MNSESTQGFYNTYCSNEKFGKLHYLIGHFITDFRYPDTWENELLPYFESIQDKTGVINDWNSFEWKGIVCFRHNYIMILNESIHQKGRKFPGLIDDQGNQILNDEYEWLLDTEFIQSNYSEFVVIPTDDFIQLCKIWIDILRSDT